MSELPEPPHPTGGVEAPPVDAAPEPPDGPDTDQHHDADQDDPDDQNDLDDEPGPDLPEPRRPDPMFQAYEVPDDAEPERPLDESHPVSLAAATYYTLDERSDPEPEPDWDPS